MSNQDLQDFTISERTPSPEEAGLDWDQLDLRKAQKLIFQKFKN